MSLLSSRLSRAGTMCSSCSWSGTREPNPAPCSLETVPCSLETVPCSWETMQSWHGAHAVVRPCRAGAGRMHAGDHAVLARGACSWETMQSCIDSHGPACAQKRMAHDAEMQCTVSLAGMQSSVSAAAMQSVVSPAPPHTLPPVHTQSLSPFHWLFGCLPLPNKTVWNRFKTGLELV
eukprot:364681-Chlamydomonas_euryale.AAC.9